ncbi:MAG: hypothetical protein MUC95_05215 [Spirochaetes bacterium]|nr:hypothetical protein [Spirochaetota bacterium]
MASIKPDRVFPVILLYLLIRKERPFLFKLIPVEFHLKSIKEIQYPCGLKLRFNNGLKGLPVF